MKTNSHILKITGGAELSESIDSAKTFKIKAELDCYAIETRDNQDGTNDIVYKARITSPIEVEQGEAKIRGKDKRRWSQKFRALLYYDAKEDGMDDYETHYNIWMEKMYKNWELIKQFLKEK